MEFKRHYCNFPLNHDPRLLLIFVEGVGDTVSELIDTLKLYVTDEDGQYFDYAWNDLAWTDRDNLVYQIELAFDREVELKAFDPTIPLMVVA